MTKRRPRPYFAAAGPGGKWRPLCTAGCAAALAWSIATHAAAVAADRGSNLVAVRVATVALSRIADVREVPGTVHARNTATVAAQVMAAVKEVPVRAGDSVKAGQILAQLDDAAAAAEYQRADADRRRYEALLSRDAATRAEYEAVIARYRVAEAALSHTRVTAPMEGLVAQRLVDPGDMAKPGSPLFVVEQLAAWRLEVQVPERLGAAPALGSSFQVRMDAAAENCTGTVSEVVPTADPATRSFTVKLDLTCPGPLRSGAFGRAMLPIDTRDAMVVPASTVRSRGQLRYVFISDNGHARMRLVRVGHLQDGGVEILAGLAAGDSVVVSADGDLVDGQAVSSLTRP